MNQSEIFDAIVVRYRISGGWAAKELCEKWVKDLWWLERGRNGFKPFEELPTDDE